MGRAEVSRGKRRFFFPVLHSDFDASRTSSGGATSAEARRSCSPDPDRRGRMWILVTRVKGHLVARVCFTFSIHPSEFSFMKRTESPLHRFSLGTNFSFCSLNRPVTPPCVIQPRPAETLIMGCDPEPADGTPRRSRGFLLTVAPRRRKSFSNQAVLV